MKIVLFIDYIVLKVDCIFVDIKCICEEVIQYQFVVVCVFLFYVMLVCQVFEGLSVCLVIVIGFLMGYFVMVVKVEEIK